LLRSDDKSGDEQDDDDDQDDDSRPMTQDELRSRMKKKLAGARELVLLVPVQEAFDSFSDA
jgi:hypothetical protein